MPAPAPLPLPTPAAAGGIVLLPATRFFVRRIPLVAGQDSETQAGLALESIGPFAPGQLYYGHYPSADGTQALVFAAYRKNFSAGETAPWTTADAVLPGFAVWLGQEAPRTPSIWLHEEDDSLAAIFWDGRSPLPAGVIAREVSGRPADAVRGELVQEARARLGASSVEPRSFRGAAAAGALTKEGLTLTLGDRLATFTPTALRAMDVRDKAELAGQIDRRQRDRRLWFVFAGAAVALAACIVVEIGLAVSHGLLARQRARLEASAAAVQQIKQANDLVVRMEQLAEQGLRPFEMLALLNGARPPSLEFVSASTVGPRKMEIEVQSGNAADPQAFEQALRRAPEIAGVELRDFRTSGGRTTFIAAIDFKPGFAAQGGAQ
ncbi:MAG TPA: hypothetical protein VHN79_08945 [Lacunisphaera sp.]|nr:hypothetical protein [Lacunisphaera sp.]